MSARPDAPVLAFLARVARRTRAIGATRGFAAGFAAAAVLILAGSAILGVTLALALAGTVLGWLLSSRSRTAMAAEIERRVARSRNLIFTAAELAETPAGAPDYVRTRVMDEAARFTRSLDLRAIAPARRTAVMLGTSLAVWSAAVAIAMHRDAAAPVARPSSDTAARIVRVEAEIAPPAYSRRARAHVVDPARIDVLAGSRVTLTVHADAARVTLDTIGGTQTLASSGPRTFSATVTADADGFLAIAPMAATGTPGVRRLIGLSANADTLPVLRVATPGHDLLVPAGPRTVPLVVDAEDDLGLASLRVKYTRVAGSGESFTFSDGEVPLDVTRASERAWTGRASWRLDGLGLEPGDLVIYRAEAADHRPGAPVSESDTYIIEIAAPGALPLAGFAIDDRQDKYAISQQMVIVRTERLLARRGSMTAADFKDEALDIAAEQRQVRAEFVFMMGGELEDAGLDLTTLNEEAEAEKEDDLSAGRLVNQGRADLIRAIRSMSRAAVRLGDADLTAALPVEKEALTYLQRAFARNRYILRALAERERVDASRRLTGLLTALARPTRPAAEPVVSARVTALRRALSDLATLAAAPVTPATAAEISALAQRMLQIDPNAATLRDAAGALAAFAQAPGAGSPGRSADALERAATALAALIRSELAAAPSRSTDPALSALDGALADALRRGARAR